MEKPRPEKVAVVDEVRNRLDSADAAILTEYRGLTVTELAELRRALAPVGGDYKIYKNTLVRLAVAGGDHGALEPLLEGPTAIAFVSGEVSAVAKALRDYARTYPSLVVKGGLYPDGFLSREDLTRLADLPPRDVLLAQLAGALAAPLRQLAGLMQALPRNMAYGLAALVDQRGGAPEAAPEAATATDEAATDEAATAEAATAEPATAEAPSAETAPSDAEAAAAPETADTETEAPAAEASGDANAEAAAPGTADTETDA
ncbi:MAG TPA: 50S ribosomal protein L10 [Acidimicrobiales bacterium]|nr:50S ribosomal protein L10 [Acidimicrobiales bacterium]